MTQMRGGVRSHFFPANYLAPLQKEPLHNRLGSQRNNSLTAPKRGPPVKGKEVEPQEYGEKARGFLGTKNENRSVYVEWKIFWLYQGRYSSRRI